MGTAVAIRGFGGMAKVQAYGQRLQQQAHFGGMDDGGLPILTLDKDEGYWRFGENNTELEEGDLLAVNPISFRHGYVAFGKAGDGLAETLDGEKAEVMQPMEFDLPTRDELPELELVTFKRGEKPREPDWQLCLSLELVVIEGPNKGETLIYKPLSKGGLRMVRKIMAEVGRKLAEGEEDCVPLIELYVDKPYKSKYGSKVYNPLFEVIEWTTPEDDGKDAPKAEKHPKKGETTAKGDPVDTRKSSKSREVEDDDADDSRSTKRRQGRDEEPAKKTRSGRGREVEEEDAPEEGTRSRRGRDEEPAKEERRSRRGRDEDAEGEAEEPRGKRSARGGRGEVDDAKSDSGRSTRRARQDDDEEEAPRTRRGAKDDSEDEREGVRGRRAAGGRRTRQ